MTKHSELINIINHCSDADKLENWITNAEREGAEDVADAARRRLIKIVAATNDSSSSDPVVLDFWKSIIALEFVLSGERNKTIRLSRTRQKISRVGVHKTLTDLTLKTTPSEGYNLLRDRGMLDLSAEAVVLRFPNQFDKEVLQAARTKLELHDDENA
ncbi:hypothetical protein [Pseudovibrio sp. Tun.PSC04-5.I4]|uniref:hypothetical protein n=1 Tax=Pseudovibrio sp. Tun.PSC04-5.I4 TaxID=1798213 RepID=UPI00087E33F1|nr:hypothetical protein [Pseudovibrio sp. Tun.PSC04-5.I4]SDQ15009.1 hypothetical protein SAMN04515695_0186 [Pseudovibrio sp. Tun.PSC04-5.I4]SDQ35707.1 hypothetical protein SAMN04515695_0949 [Pseudovibrio sp. Tun.PSC04-5.I4]SDQ35915.1 hypothetical protein SAMN04515695_0958 [Pseudovibrio sp. Tun.PSC04-5.I4]